MPGRGNFQPVGAIDRVGDVEHRRQRARGGLAILDRHGAVRPLGHDLHGAAGQRRKSRTRTSRIAEAREHRLGDRGDARRNARLGDQARLHAGGGIGFGHPARVAFRNSRFSCPDADPACAAVQVTKRAGPGGPTLKSRSDSSDRYEVSETDAPNIAICRLHARAKRSADLNGR